MSKSVNKVMLLGHAGKDPDVHILRSGTVVNLSLATRERYKDTFGEWQERTEWHNLVGHQRIGEILRDYVTKGSRLYVEGSLRTRSWDDRESGQRKYRTEIVVHDITLLSQPNSPRDASGTEEFSGGDAFVSTGYATEPEITREQVPY